MKVLLISADNIYLVPYIKMYINALEIENINYKVLYWDKNQNETNQNEKYIRFSIKSKNKISKVAGYFKFRKKIKQVIKKDSIDYIICLHTISNLLIWDILMNNFKNKFIFDVRDYSYENYQLVQKIEKKLVKFSSLNIVSSDGYKKFLPPSNYMVSHNVPENMSDLQRETFKHSSNVLNISYIGLIRFMDQNKKIILFFKNDPRYHLNFIGTNASLLQSFCKQNNVNNVTLIDTFNPNETLSFFENTDLIMNLYGNHTPLLDYALSNKLYYAALLKKPILVCEDTYMEKISKYYQFGYSLKLDKNEEKDNLYSWYNSIDKNKFNRNCNLFLEKVKIDQIKLNQKLKEIFKND